MFIRQQQIATRPATKGYHCVSWGRLYFGKGDNSENWVNILLDKVSELLAWLNEIL